MTGPITLKNASDAFVNEAKPSKSVPGASRLAVRSSGSSLEHRAFIYFGLPFPRGVTIINGTFRFYTGDSTQWPASGNITVQAVSSKFSMSRVDWTNQPGVTGSTVTIACVPSADNQAFEMDVTSLLQAVSDGASWFGLRIISSTDEYKWIHSSDSIDDYRPELDVEWSDAPEIPTELAPDGSRAISLQYPVFRCDFTDISGNTQMQAIKVQAAAAGYTLNADGSFVTPELDTGSYSASEPELDSSLFSGAPWNWSGLASAATRYWIVNVQDGAGLWSGWSSPAVVTRQAHGTLTITNPAASPSNYVEEPTPPINWTFTGQTQRAYEVSIFNADDLALGVLWTTGKITDSSTTSVTVPKGIIKKDGTNYRVRIRIWDTIDREKTPGDTIYVEATRDFTRHYATGITPVSNLTGTPDNVYGVMQLDFQRTSAPDSFAVLRDGEVVDADIVPSEVFVSGTSYRIYDRSADPRKSHTWKILCIVNGQTDDNGPSVTDTVRTKTTLIQMADGTRTVFLFNYSYDAQRRGETEAHYVVGNAPPVLVTQSIRGVEGQVGGIVADTDVSGLSADTQAADLDWYEDHIGTQFLLKWINRCIKVVARDVAYNPILNDAGQIVEYAATLEFFEDDF